MMPTPEAPGGYSPASATAGGAASSSSGRTAPPPPPLLPSTLVPAAPMCDPGYPHHPYSYHQVRAEAAADPHSVTPAVSEYYSPHPHSGGIGRALAMEGPGGATQVRRSTRDSRLTSRSSSSEAEASSSSPRPDSPVPLPRPAGVTPPRRQIVVGVKRKKRVVRRNRLTVKTPGTAAANGAATGDGLASKTPPSLREEHRGGKGGRSDPAAVTLSCGGRTNGGYRQGDELAVAASLRVTAPSIPSPQSGGGGPPYTSLVTAGSGNGSGSALLRPRPSALPPPLPPQPSLAHPYHPQSESEFETALLSSASCPASPQESLFPDPFQTVDQSALSGADDPLFWAYDLGREADPRSFNAHRPAMTSLPPPPVGRPRGYSMIPGGYVEPPLPSLPPAEGGNTWSGDDFDFGRQMGKGKFGIVYGVTEKTTGQSMALKVLNKARVLKCSVAPKLLRREVEIQSRLNHENIVRLHGYYHDDVKCCLLLQRAPDGDLYQLMSKRTDRAELLGSSNCGALPHPVAASFTAQVASALSYLSLHHVAHRDIKPENLLLEGTVDGEPTTTTTVKLADFGWAVRAPPPLHHRRSTLCGTPEYVPPEMIRNSPSTPDRSKSSSNRKGSPSRSLSSLSSPSVAARRNYDASFVDAWALGVLACEMVRGKTPFFLSLATQKTIAAKRGYSNAHESVFDLIRDFKPEMVAARDRHEGQSGNSEADERDFVRLARALLRDRPESRMDVRDVASHPWVMRNRSAVSCGSRKRSDGGAFPTGRQVKKRTKQATA
eukprot:CAMPEP_0113553036 /NCGR_PEP_ID=MMETSP0015_2-20120614/15392_1 /TAXON_ID=2838 /ORGANISM="Odontella" /LENGTH=774 /DNA_ID=CAMNT_0000454065 /DNA_START=614 /DNA_END=2938 /DNA_ORIENTATION=- /assembly_acc=CAM_ASM_000160